MSDPVVQDRPITNAELCRRRALIGEIMLVVQANHVFRADEVLLALAFRSESELRQISRELCVHPLPS